MHILMNRSFEEIGTEPDLNTLRINIGPVEGKVEERIAQWMVLGVKERLWRSDPTIWFKDPPGEITNRLGWLHAARNMRHRLDDLQKFAAQIRDENISHVTLLGMGGSSLAPEVFARVFGARDGYPKLSVLDSTHPDAVRAVSDSIDWARHLFIVSSKSGTTLETLSLFQYFWDKAENEFSDAAGSRFIAVTDPGSPLETLAREHGFRNVFQAQSDLGGRYSALSEFGIVPASVMGAETDVLLDRAIAAADHCKSCNSEVDDAGIVLGAVLGELALAGRNKVTFLTTRSLDPLPTWMEQLIAESTGKNGKGILPVIGEPLRPIDKYGDDRVFVALTLSSEPDEVLDHLLGSLSAYAHPVIRICLSDVMEIGAEMFRWEVAVALAGAVLGIHPFNQPDVQLAKDLAQKAMESGSKTSGGGEAPAPTAFRAEEAGLFADSLETCLSGAKEGGYLALQAYVPPTPKTSDALQQLRATLAGLTSFPTTLGYGPRFLHSTGQIHKGGPDNGVFVQICAPATENDLPVPGAGYTFGQMIRGQADGDYRALRARGRQVLRIDVGQDIVAGLTQITEALGTHV